MRALPEDPRGTLVLLGGRGDYIERYFETARDILARGFAVASRRPARPGRIAAQEPRDLPRHHPLFRRLRGRHPHADGRPGHPHLPAALLSRSAIRRGATSCSACCATATGSARRYWSRRWSRSSMARGPGPLRRCWSTACRWRAMARWFLPGVRKKPMGRADFPGNPLTSDRRRWERDSSTLEAAPHLGLGGPTFAWLQAARRSLKEVKTMERPRAPVLIVAAGGDRVVGNEGIRRLARECAGHRAHLHPRCPP